MNMNHFKLARRQLAGVPEGEFSISSWQCGTTACFAGWVSRLNCLVDHEEMMGEDIYNFAREWLDISRKAADWLFFAQWRYNNPTTLPWWVSPTAADHDATRDRFLRELDTWIAAGDVPEHLRHDPPDGIDY